VSGDVVILQGTAVGVFADKNVGNAKPVAVSGLSLAGADAGNYSLQLTGLFADITPATLTFTALAAQVVAGSALPVFTGALSGFVAGDDLANATTGELSWSSPATAASPAGSYAIQGGGLAAANYRFVQADSNATALTLTAAASNDTASNTTATNFAFALNAVQLPAVTSTPESGRVLDVVQSLASSAETGSTGYVYRSVNFSLLSRDEMQGLLAARAGYKKKVFATTISKLEQDPTLADVRGCGNEAELATGNCLITEALKVDIQAKAARAAVKPPKRAQRKLKQVTLPNIERKLALLIGINKYSRQAHPRAGRRRARHAGREARCWKARLGYEATVVADASREGHHPRLQQAGAGSRRQRLGHRLLRRPRGGAAGRRRWCQGRGQRLLAAGRQRRRNAAELDLQRRHLAPGGPGGASSSTSTQCRTGVVVPVCRCWMQPMLADTMACACSGPGGPACGRAAGGSARAAARCRCRPSRSTGALVRPAGQLTRRSPARPQALLDPAAQLLAVLQRAGRVEGQAALGLRGIAQLAA
jgi:hypothetical protein